MSSAYMADNLIPRHQVPQLEFRIHLIRNGSIPSILVRYCVSEGRVSEGRADVVDFLAH